MLDESGRLDVVRVREDELLVLRRCADLLAELGLVRRMREEFALRDGADALRDAAE